MTRIEPDAGMDSGRAIHVDGVLAVGVDRSSPIVSNRPGDHSRTGGRSATQ
ncbi:MAG: hypothetical protein Q4C47_07075 [Planctomycetia bacterium]|nr:hypothetical protein [Planctomycetia bacterium]